MVKVLTGSNTIPPMHFGGLRATALVTGLLSLCMSVCTERGWMKECERKGREKAWIDWQSRKGMVAESIYRAWESIVYGWVFIFLCSIIFWDGVGRGHFGVIEHGYVYFNFWITTFWNYEKCLHGFEG